MRYLLNTKNGFCFWDTGTKSGRYIDNDKISAFDIREDTHKELIDKILTKGVVAASYTSKIERVRFDYARDKTGTL